MVATLVYDAECGFCRWSLAWLLRRLPMRPRVRAARTLAPGEFGISADQAARSAWWVDSSGVYGGHEVFARWLRACGGLWALPGRVLTWPVVSPVCAGVYRLIAANRHRIPGPWARTCPVIR